MPYGVARTVGLFGRFPANSLFGRILRLPIRLMPGSVALPILTGPGRGLQWYVRSSNISIWCGFYELQLAATIDAAVPIGGVFYDVGANAGYYSLLAARRASHVIAFEPHPGAARLLESHVERNRLTNVTILREAVARKTGRLKFDPGNLSILAKLDRHGTETVAATTLDNVVGSRAPPPDVIKMDIQGGEFDALQGAEKTLRNFSPVLFVETHSQKLHRDCGQLLKEYGYDVEETANWDEWPEGRLKAWKAP